VQEVPVLRKKAMDEREPEAATDKAASAKDKAETEIAKLEH